MMRFERKEDGGSMYKTGEEEEILREIQNP